MKYVRWDGSSGKGMGFNPLVLVIPTMSITAIQHQEKSQGVKYHSGNLVKYARKVLDLYVEGWGFPSPTLIINS